MRILTAILLALGLSSCATPVPEFTDYLGSDAAVFVRTARASPEGKAAQGVGVNIYQIDGRKPPRRAEEHRVAPGERVFLLYAFDGTEARAQGFVQFTAQPGKRYRIGATRPDDSWIYTVRFYEQSDGGEIEVATAELRAGVPVTIPVFVP